MVLRESEEKIISRNSLNFKTDSAIININQEASLISIGWDSHTRPEDFKVGYQLAADLVKRFYIRNWLNDARNMAYLNIENQNWIYRCIVPQLMQNNMHKLARVVMDEPLAILVSCNILDQITNSPEPNGKLDCEIFTDFDNALFWLAY
jgi:hypothetical protein